MLQKLTFITLILFILTTCDNVLINKKSSPSPHMPGWTLTNFDCGSLNDIYFIDDNKGYIVGDHSIILSTADAGKTWKKIKNRF